MPKEKLEEYSNKYNRAKHQCEFLYNLLKNDMDLYVELEDAIKYLNLFYCPGNSEECHFVLAKYRVHKHIDKIYESAIGKNAYCRLKGTNIFGIIGKELDSTDRFPEQWGIYWLGYSEGKEYGDEIKKIKGHLYYWQDKSKIELIPYNKFREKNYGIRPIFKHYGN